MGKLKNFDTKELNLILESLQRYDEYLATIIRDRSLWKWEEFKNSNLCGFEKEEEFKNWVNDMNENTKAKMEQVENVSEKIEDIIYGE